MSVRWRIGEGRKRGWWMMDVEVEFLNIVSGTVRASDGRREVLPYSSFPL